VLGARRADLPWRYEDLCGITVFVVEDWPDDEIPIAPRQLVEGIRRRLDALAVPTERVGQDDAPV
jgi:hypothetical protein